MRVNAKARFLKYLEIPAVEFVHMHAAITKLQAKLRENIIDHKENQKIMSCFSSNSYLWSRDELFYKNDKINHFLSPPGYRRDFDGVNLAKWGHHIFKCGRSMLLRKALIFLLVVFAILNLFKQKLLLNRIEKSKISLQPHTFIMHRWFDSSWDGSCRMYNECVELNGNLTNKKWCLNSPSSLIHEAYR